MQVLRRSLAARYRSMLTRANVAVPPECDAGHVYHLFPVLSTKRDAFQAHLATRGVGTLVHYPLSLPEQPALAEFARTDCPVAHRVASEVCSLPLHPHLTDEDADLVANAVKSFA